ncbi:hypothetical protein Tco_0071346 [Tanacetum coccineum]
MDELTIYDSEKTYAYGAIRAMNQDLLSTISELKTRLEKVEKVSLVNTKLQTKVSQSLLCVTPLNKHAFQKKTDVSKIEENHVVLKPVTSQTSSNQQTRANQNKNVIKPGMYRVVTTQESQINKTKSGLSSTGVNATSRVVQIVLWVVDNGLVSNILRILLLTGGRESNCILILQSHLAASSPFCIIPKATSTSHCYGTEDCHIFNFEYTINDHIPDYLLTVLPSFKDGKDHLVLLVNGEKQEKASLHLNCSSISPCHNQSSVTICNRVLKKHGLDECVSMSTPMATERLYADLQGTLTDQTYLRGLQFLGGKLVSWSSKKQDCTAMSTAEAEYTEYQLADLFTKALQKNVYENLVHLIIMAQQQHAADVHPDELCPPNKRYDLMDATRSNLEMCNCSDDESHQQESSITIQHCSFFIGSMDLYGTVLAYFEGIRIKVSAQVYAGTRKLTLTLDRLSDKSSFSTSNCQQIYNSFMPPPSFSDMVPFYKQVLGFTMELKIQSIFKTTCSHGKRYAKYSPNA